MKNYKMKSENITLLTAVPALLVIANCGGSLITRILFAIAIAAIGFFTGKTFKKAEYSAIAHGVSLGAAIAAGYNLLRLIVNITAFVLSKKFIGLALFVIALIIIVKYKKTGKVTE